MNVTKHSLLITTALLIALSQAAVGAGTMEVRPLVLTSQEIQCRIPCPAGGPRQVRMEIRLTPLKGGTTRVAQVAARWEPAIRTLKQLALYQTEPVSQSEQGVWVVEIPIGTTRPGGYRAEAKLLGQPEVKEGPWHADFTLHARPAWLDAKAGIQGRREVPRSWTPVTVSQAEAGIVLGCWNRKTVLTRGTSLIEQLTSGERLLLTGPIDVDARDRTGNRLRPDGDWKVESRGDHQVTLTKLFRCPGTTMSVKLRKEFDGFIWCTLDILSTPGLSKLEVSAPLNSQFVQWIYSFKRDYYGDLANLERCANPGTWGIEFQPQIWFGDPQGGLVWCAQSCEHWERPHEKNTIRLEAREKTSVLHLNILKGRAKLKNANIGFGWQVTPVRSQPDPSILGRVSLWHGEPGPSTLDTLKNAGYSVVSLSEPWTKDWGDTEPANPDYLRKLVNAAHEREMKVIVYFGWEVGTGLEWTKRFGWELTHDGRTDPEAATSKKGWGTLPFGRSTMGPEQERILAGMQRLLTEYKVDGFYLGGTQIPGGCSNPYIEGATWQDEAGKTYGTFTILASRDFAKRMRWLVDHYRPGGVIYGHTSAILVIATNGFCDILFNGEQMLSSPAWRSYWGADPAAWFF